MGFFLLHFSHPLHLFLFPDYVMNQPSQSTARCLKSIGTNYPTPLLISAVRMMMWCPDKRNNNLCCHEVVSKQPVFLVNVLRANSENISDHGQLNWSVYARVQSDMPKHLYLWWYPCQCVVSTFIIWLSLYQRYHKWPALLSFCIENPHHHKS